MLVVHMMLPEDGEEASAAGSTTGAGLAACGEGKKSMGVEGRTWNCCWTVAGAAEGYITWVGGCWGRLEGGLTGQENMDIGFVEGV